MKIAVSAMEPRMESDLEPRFGRSPYFVLVDPETVQFETLKNPNTEQSSGAGIGRAELICERGVGAVITGMISPKASRVLSAARVRMLTGVEGKVGDAIRRYREGGLIVERYREESPGKTRGKAWDVTVSEPGTLLLLGLGLIGFVVLRKKFTAPAA